MAGQQDDRCETDTRPTLVALHFLGGSADAWSPVFERLDGRFRFVAIDLPGFGAAVRTAGYDVAAMADHVATAVRQLSPRRWFLLGHSMGAKVACAVARAAEDGAQGLDGLTHLVLLAGSPPRPEPMEESKRETMRGWFAGDEAERRAQADGYIRDNAARELPPQLHASLVDGVLAAERAAWLAWLESGSREDWAERIGILRTPALVIAGAEDSALGPDTQRTVMAPHLASARFHTLPGTGHLLPSEQPAAVAALIDVFVGKPRPEEPAVPAGYRALIDSHRVSQRTRDVLLARADQPPKTPNLISPDETGVLQALVERIIPQPVTPRIDIAARLLRQFADGGGDGWRFAELASDVPALRSGLDNLDAIARTLDVAGFAYLSGVQQDALLMALLEGKLQSPLLPEHGGLTTDQLQLWFEDMRSFATQIYVSHPATQARIGYSGIGNRGDGSGPQGFRQVGLGQPEAWEPRAETGADR